MNIFEITLFIFCANGKDFQTKMRPFATRNISNHRSMVLKVVKESLLSFGEPPEELVVWTERTEWMKDVLNEWKKNKDEELLKKLTLSSKEGRM